MSCQHNLPMTIQALHSPTMQTEMRVPANHIGFRQAAISVAQLKIIQEVVTLTVFVPFAFFFLKEPLKWDYLWAGFCLMGAVYFVFRQ